MQLELAPGLEIRVTSREKDRLVNSHICINLADIITVS